MWPGQWSKVVGFCQGSHERSQLRRLHVIRDSWADLCVMLPILPSITCIEFGLFNPARLAINQMCPVYFRHSGRKTCGQGAISCGSRI
jgi:hypothetical protein